MDNLNKIFPEAVSKIILLYSESKIQIYIVRHVFVSHWNGGHELQLTMYKSLNSANNHAFDIVKTHYENCENHSFEDICEICSICSSGRHTTNCRRGGEYVLTCKECDQILKDNIRGDWYCETCEESSVGIQYEYIDPSAKDKIFFMRMNL